jgi:hypothetical protein
MSRVPAGSHRDLPAHRGDQAGAADLRNLLKRGEVADLFDPASRSRIGEFISRAASDRPIAGNQSPHVAFPTGRDVSGGCTLTQEEYRGHAARCLKLAEDVCEHQSKVELINMACSWMRLADLADRNGSPDLVYETPPRRPPPPH